MNVSLIRLPYSLSFCIAIVSLIVSDWSVPAFCDEIRGPLDAVRSNMIHLLISKGAAIKGSGKNQR
jgi:hypothetical protein